MQTTNFRNLSVLPQKAHRSIEANEAGVLKTMAYFDIFQYPLTISEIRQFMKHSVTETMLDKALQNLLEDGSIFQFNEFYCLQNNSSLASKRSEGNQRAAKLLPKAMRNGRFLFKFPFVRAISISGSLSKKFADEKADVDYFIIAKTNRLWIARTLMHLFKKFTFLTRQQHYYCMNYYIDEQALEIEHKNIFTATEVKTLLPVRGLSSLHDFFVANEWANDFLPSCPFPVQASSEKTGTWFKRWIEWTLNNKMGDRLDNFLMKITIRRWQRKKRSGKQNIKGQVMDLITDKHFAWSNPASFQEKVLFEYNKKLDDLKFRMPQWFDELSLSYVK